jgi:hypothetical protein
MSIERQAALAQPAPPLDSCMPSFNRPEGRRDRGAGELG